MKELNKIYMKIIRPMSMDGNVSIIHDAKKITIRDVISESILPSPHKLINDIVERLHNENEFTYSKKKLIDLSDKTWEFFENLLKTSDSFTLTVLRSDRYEYERRFSSLPSKNAQMMEVVDPDDMNEEFIWMNSEDEENYIYDESFRNMLKHELGHVWTFKFGTDNDSFVRGQAESNESSLDVNDFTQYQLDVLLSLYNRNLKLLEDDYRYVLQKIDETDSANFELATNIDNILEILIADYFESGIQSTTAYLSSTWRKLSLDLDFSLNSMNLLKHYKENMLYDGYKSIKHIKNAIRKLFLIFAFGTKEQINYFKNECEKEFGEI